MSRFIFFLHLNRLVIQLWSKESKSDRVTTMLLIDYAAEESIVWLDHGLIKVPELRLFVVLGAKKSLIEVEMNILALMGL